MTEQELNERGQKIDTLLKLADASWKAHDTRRSYEWKVNLALWPGLALFAALQIKGETTLSLKLPSIIILSLLLIAIAYIYSTKWSAGLREGNRRDKIREETYLRLVDQELKLDNRSPRPTTDVVLAEEPILKNWSHGSQILITWLLVFFAISSMFAAAYSANELTQESKSSTHNQTNQLNCNCQPKPCESAPLPGKVQNDSSKKASPTK